MNAKQDKFITEYIPKIQGIKERKSEAYRLREEFVNYFTIDKIRNLSLEEYSLGNEHSIHNFSYGLESMLDGLGGIQGISSEKFGVWFSPTKGKYSIARTYQKYGTVDAAYEAVRSDIIEIIKAGEKEDFEAFTNSKINEYLKSKILSVYYPDRYLSIFKKQTLIDLVKFFDLHPKREGTIYQREALWELHNDHPIMKEWPVDIYCTFLWDCFIQLGGQVDKPYTIKENTPSVKQWVLGPGEDACMWPRCQEQNEICIDWLGTEDLTQYKTKDEYRDMLRKLYNKPEESFMNDRLCLYEFTHVMKPGDIVYARKGINKIVGRGIIESDYIFNDSYETSKHIRKIKWTHIGEWDAPWTFAQKTLTEISKYPDAAKQVEDLFTEKVQVEVDNTSVNTVYSEKDFLEEVFMREEQLAELLHLIKRKKNIILQGAPGVGKTYCAKRMAYTLMGEKNDSRISFVQFHQNYSYEDFIMGYKPEGESFELKEGVFFRFCRKALSDPKHDYFFIIDEINRGNMSKIFGELLMLIEKDYRGTFASLPYREERFTVPSNVYLIGMMNTADRSLAMIDYALRRRFSFVEMEPGFETEGFKAYQESLASDIFDQVVKMVEELNLAICEDDTLGKGFQIGHSYLCGIAPEECNEALLHEIVKYDILPTLAEYWFDDADKVEQWSNKFIGLFE